MLLFKRIQVETLKECLSYCPPIANPVSHAAKGNLPNFEAVTLSLSKAKESVVSITSRGLPKDHRAVYRSSREEAKGSCKWITGV